MIKDKYDHEIRVDDFVLFYSALYQVKDLIENFDNTKNNAVRMRLIHRGDLELALTCEALSVSVLSHDQAVLKLLKYS